MSRDYLEARRAAEVGHASSLATGRVIPGLYGLRLGFWIPWHEDREIRVMRVDAAFGMVT